MATRNTVTFTLNCKLEEDNNSQQGNPIWHKQMFHVQAKTHSKQIHVRTQTKHKLFSLSFWSKVKRFLSCSFKNASCSYRLQWGEATKVWTGIWEKTFFRLLLSEKRSCIIIS